MRTPAIERAPGRSARAAGSVVLFLLLATLAALTSLASAHLPVLAQPATPATDGSACVVVSEPNDQPADAVELPPGASCASAENADGGQDLYRWTVTEAEATSRWTISTSAIAGQVATLDVYTIEEDETGNVLSATKLVAAIGQLNEAIGHRNLLWAPGTYYIAVATSDPGPYQLTIAEGNPIPDDTGSAAVDVSDAFAVSGDQAGPEAEVTWTIDDAAGSHWTLQLQGPVALYLQVAMANAAGDTLITLPVSPDGIASIPDLGLPAGAYTISITSNAGEAAPWILEASPGDPIVAGHETEPNETAATAMLVPLTENSIGMNGRLATRGAEDTSDVDRYRLSIDADHSGRLVDIRMLWQGGSTRKLCLLDGTEQELRCIEGADGLALSDLVLAEGDYLIVVSGAPVPDDAYTIRIDITGEAAADFEAEPNDSAAYANPLAPRGEGFDISGRFGGAEHDTFRITVTGEPQLWLFEATGPGVSQIDLLDVIGSGIARGQPVDGTASLYDVFLVPGDHVVQVSGENSDYTLTATPLGPPDPLNEREPNDTLDRSEPLLLLDQRTGRLVDPADSDVYRFALQNSTYLRVTVEAPDDGAVGMALNLGTERIAKARSPDVGQALTYDGWFEPGDYSIWLTTGTSSKEQYRLTVEPLDPFTLPADLEPNDQPTQARPMPASLSVSGSSNPFTESGDADWYALPAMDAPAQLAVTYTPGMTIQIVIPGDAMSATVDIPLTPGSGDSEALADVPADTPVLLRIYGSGPYDLSVIRNRANASSPPPATPEPGTVPVSISLDLGDRPIAAYWIEGQRIDAQVTLANRGTVPADVALDAMTGHARWTVELPEPSLTLAAGETRAGLVTS